MIDRDSAQVIVAVPSNEICDQSVASLRTRRLVFDGGVRTIYGGNTTGIAEAVVRYGSSLTRDDTHISDLVICWQPLASSSNGAIPVFCGFTSRYNGTVGSCRVISPFFGRDVLLSTCPRKTALMLELCKSLRDDLSIGAVSPPLCASTCGRPFQYIVKFVAPKPYVLRPRIVRSIGERVVGGGLCRDSSKGLVWHCRVPGDLDLLLNLELSRCSCVAHVSVIARTFGKDGVLD